MLWGKKRLKNHHTKICYHSFIILREDAAIMEKVCSSNSRAHTQTSLNKVVIPGPTLRLVFIM